VALQSISEACVTSCGWGWVSRFRWADECVCRQQECPIQRKSNGIDIEEEAVCPCVSLCLRRCSERWMADCFTWILMKMWLTCILSHWVVQSDSSLFGWFCIMYSWRKRIRLAVHGRRLVDVLASHKDGNCLPSALLIAIVRFLYFELEWLLIECFIRSEWSWGLLHLFFCFLDGDDWSIQCGILSDCTPALVWGECFSTVLLEVKRTERLFLSRHRL